ncbi:hypothetical protein ACPJHQ_00995 [Rossellomorea sp. H39__3]
MGKLESKVKDALSEIKSADPDVRHDGLMKLKDITVENKGGECDISLLKDMIKLAAGPFERTGEEWDDPSLVLLEFVVDYMEERVARDLTRHIAEFSEMGKQCVLYHTSMHEHDGAVRALIEMYESLIPLNQAWFPHAVLEQNGVVSKALINHFYTRLDDKACRRDLYRILANLHEEKVFYQFKPEVIKPLIHRHWEEAKAAYLQYDRDYKTKHVHCSWKDSYLHIREELENFLKLMDVYWGEEWLPYLEEAKGGMTPLSRRLPSRYPSSGASPLIRKRSTGAPPMSSQRNYSTGGSSSIGSNITTRSRIPVNPMWPGPTYSTICYLTVKRASTRRKSRFWIRSIHSPLTKSRSDTT